MLGGELIPRSSLWQFSETTVLIRTKTIGQAFYNPCRFTLFSVSLHSRFIKIYDLKTNLAPTFQCEKSKQFTTNKGPSRHSATKCFWNYAANLDKIDISPNLKPRGSFSMLLSSIRPNTCSFFYITVAVASVLLFSSATVSAQALPSHEAVSYTHLTLPTTPYV